MYNNKQILILTLSHLPNDPRAYRQIRYLKDYYNVTTAGIGKSKEEGIDHIEIESPVNRLLHDKIPVVLFMKFGLFEKCYWNFPIVKEGLKSINDNLYDVPYDLVIAHDLISLPLALLIAKKSDAKVLLDAHEYYPRQYEDQWINRLFYNKLWNYICFKYMPKVDAIITVSQGIADEYKKHYGVNCRVITNIPFFADLNPSPISQERINMIYHGNIHPSRRTEDMIHLMNYLDNRFYLNLMINKNPLRYFKKLYGLSQNNPRIKFLNTVPMPDIAKTINKFDIGLFLLSPSSFSYLMALPNKLFEFVQGRLCVAIWPSPEMARIVGKYNCGIVSENFTIESMANKLNALSVEDVMKFKENAHQAAPILCAEKNKDILLDIVKGLMGK